MKRKIQVTGQPQVIGYVRVSTDEQGLSVEAQKASIEAWCAQHEAVLVAVYEDIGISGGAALDKRPGLLEALDALENGGVLLATKRDRIARDTLNAAMIERMVERAGASMQTVDGIGSGDTPEAKLMRHMIDAFAEYERAIIRGRIRVALGHKKAKQERISRHIPYGFMLHTDGIHLIPHAGEQEVIALAQSYHECGMSSRGIAARLAEQGYYSRVDTVFGSNAICKMVA